MIGGGVIGLSIARELRRRHTDTHMLLIEKEPSCGTHASAEIVACSTWASTIHRTASRPSLPASATNGSRPTTRRNAFPSIHAANLSLRKLPPTDPRSMNSCDEARFDFRRLALEEVAKYSRSTKVSLASVLDKGVDERNYQTWGLPGIRAQLLDITKKNLEMDFMLEGDCRSMHVLNAVSPACTCSLPFSSHVCDHIYEASA
ncbi:MAG: FAD-dependent oxidoreductase [Nitrospira sp.]|nr:FAD-dependent oxidoreductase [Nitrospira sp.]